jgi:regulatory protein
MAVNPTARATRSAGFPRPDVSALAGNEIRSIRRHQRRADRYQVTTAGDGDLTLTVADDAVARLGLHEGDVLSAGSAGELVREAQRCWAFDRAVVALTSRGRSRRELELWLLRRGVPSPMLVETMKRLERLGALDDARYAAEFVRTRVGGAGASVWALRRALARKGIARETADAVIAEVMRDADVDEHAMALREAEKKWRSLERLDRRVARRRLMGFLQRRGFSGDVVRAVLSEVA